MSQRLRDRIERLERLLAEPESVRVRIAPWARSCVPAKAPEVPAPPAPATEDRKEGRE